MIFMYNQYYNNMGIMPNVPKRGIDWGNLLNNTQRTLGIINQAIPIVYQVKPLLNNARTLFKIANSVNSIDDTLDDNDTYYENTSYQNEKKDSNGPIFFL